MARGKFFHNLVMSPSVHEKKMLVVRIGVGGGKVKRGGEVFTVDISQNMQQSVRKFFTKM